METRDTTESLIPNDLLERVEELAAAEQRTSSDVLREAVQSYLHERRARIDAQIAPRRDLQEVVDRILESRKGRVPPEGETIRDLMTYGRA